MKKFNSLFVAGKTWVMLAGEYQFARVSEIHETRKWIKVDGYEGSFQRAHIAKFSNKSAPPIIAQPAPYFSDQYGSVYERGEHQNRFVGKLNGRTLKQFLADMECRELYADLAKQLNGEMK